MLQSVSIDSALISSEFCHPKCVCMDSLVINQCDFSYLSWYPNMQISGHSRLVE